MHQKSLIVLVPVIVKSPPRASTVSYLWASSDPPNLNLQKILEAAQAHIRKRNNPAMAMPEIEEMEIPLPPLPAAQVPFIRGLLSKRL